MYGLRSVKYKSIKNWPENERPRERLLKFGADGLSTAELFAVILRTGDRDKSALELAREVLAHFNSLKEIEDAAIAELGSLKGIGEAKIAQIKAAFALGRRLFQGDKYGERHIPSFRNSREVFDYFMPRFYGLKKEKFLCALLDSKNRVFRESVVSEGTLTMSPVHPREVFREAIKEAAASVLFIHNHPSGDPTPSNDDIHITRRLVETGKVVGINVLDHIVISDENFLSMMEKGYID